MLIVSLLGIRERIAAKERTTKLFSPRQALYDITCGYEKVKLIKKKKWNGGYQGMGVETKLMLFKGINIQGAISKP